MPAPRAGYVWAPDLWRQHSRWDKDGDGIPNQYDRHDSRKDYRTNNATNPLGDRDHDCIPNVLDTHNNNRRQVAG